MAKVPTIFPLQQDIGWEWHSVPDFSPQCIQKLPWTQLSLNPLHLQPLTLHNQIDEVRDRDPFQATSDTKEPQVKRRAKFLKHAMVLDDIWSYQRFDIRYPKADSSSSESPSWRIIWRTCRTGTFRRARSWQWSRSRWGNGWVTKFWYVEEKPLQRICPIAIPKIETIHWQLSDISLIQ